MHFRALVLFMILAISVFSALDGIAFAESEWRVYKATSDDTSFKIPYKMTNGDVKDMMGDPILGMLLIHIETDPSNNGTIELTVPRNLVDSKINVDGRMYDVDLLVSVDGDNVPSEEINASPCFRTISFDLLAGSKQIFVSGISGFAPEEEKDEEDDETESSSIYITTDKNHYKQGEAITVSGCTYLNLDDENLVLEVMNPEGQIFKTVLVTPNSDGSFSTSMVAEGDLAMDGTYTARATYAGETASSTFIVPEFPLAALLAFAVGISAIMIFARAKRVNLRTAPAA